MTAKLYVVVDGGTKCSVGTETFGPFALVVSQGRWLRLNRVEREGWAVVRAMNRMKDHVALVKTSV